jgi:hypothetical protein
METNRTLWGVLTLTAFIALLLAALLLPPLPKGPTRVSRIHGVNHIASASLPLSSAKPLPTGMTKE